MFLIPQIFLIFFPETNFLEYKFTASWFVMNNCEHNEQKDKKLTNVF